MSRGRDLILALLLILALAAWGVLVWQSSSMAESGAAMGPTMGLRTPVFLAIWIVMMVAMMFPTAAPMILMFARVHADKRKGGRPFVPTWVFVSAYLLIWSLFGVLAYLGARGVEVLAQQSMLVMDNAARIGGALLILAGSYQLTPLKHVCLSKCRSPFAFIMGSWREGYAGSFRMGLEHGLYCLGCCWFLFVILFPLGVMNIIAMALVTLLIFAEKSLPRGEAISRIAGGVLVAFGVMVIAVPGLLPAVMQ